LRSLLAGTGSRLAVTGVRRSLLAGTRGRLAVAGVGSGNRRPPGVLQDGFFQDIRMDEGGRET
jgi:hypothetical protein